MSDDMNVQIVLESTNESEPGFNALNEAIQAANRLVEDLQKSFNEMAAGITAAIERAASDIRALTVPLETTAEEVATTFAGPAQAAEAQLSHIGDGLKNVAKDAETAANAVVKDMEQAATKSEEAMSRVGQATAGHASHGDSGGLLGVQGQMNSMYAGMAMAGFAAPIILGFKEAIQTAAELDQSMRNVNTMMQLPEEQFEVMKQQVVDLTRKLPYSANEMANALYQVYSANVPLNESLNFTKIAAESAAAGLGTTDDSVLALTEVIKGYGMAWGSVQNVSDMMFQTIKDGQTTFPELSKSIGSVANMAYNSGVSLKELMAAYSTLTGVTGNTAEVTTQLSGVFKEVIHPSKQAAAEAKRIGLEFSTSAIQSEGFATWLQHVKEKTGGSAEELGKLFPNVRALRGIMALSTTQMETYTQKLDNMTHASDGAGQTSNALAQAMKGEQDQFQLFKNNLAEIGEEMNKDILPAINALLPKVEEFVHWMGEHPSLTKFAIEGLAVAGGLAAIGSSLSFMVSGIGALVSFATDLGILGGTAEAVGGTAVALEGVSAGAAAAGGGLMAMLGPIGLVAGAALGLGVVLYHLFQTKPVKEFFWGKDYAQDIKDASNQAVTDVVNMTNQVETKLLELRATGGKISQDTAKVITDSADKMYQQSVQAANDRLNKETAEANQLKQNLKGVTDQQVAEMIKNAQALHDGDVAEAKKTHDDVIAEITKLKNDGVNVTSQMVDDIIAKYEKQRDQTIKILADTRDQANAVLDMLKHQTGKITAEQAEQTIQDANKTYQATVDKANQMYKDTVLQIEHMRSEGIIKTDDMKNQLIQKAQDQRDGIINAAQETHDKVVNSVNAMAVDVGSAYDHVTGKALSAFQQMQQGFQNFLTWLGHHNIGTLIDPSNGNGFAQPGDIHKYAGGTDNHPGGLALVGEEGEELVELPAGSKVHSARETRNIFQGASSGRGWSVPPIAALASGNTTIVQVYASGNITRNEQELGDIVARRLISKMKLQTRFPK